MSLSLPTKKSKPLVDWMDYTLFVYGPPKIGKSSLFKHSDYLYLAFEKGLKALGVYKRYIKNWEQFLGYVELLEKQAERKTLKYKGIVIDTAEKMFLRCLRHVCEERNIEHPQDEPYGKGWEALRNELESAVDRLENLPIGKAFISHSHVSSIVTRRKETSRISPKLTGTARSVILSQVDGIIYVGYSQSDNETRRLYLRGTELIEAGGRYEEVFDLPKSIKYRQSKGGHSFGLEDLQKVMVPRKSKITVVTTPKKEG